MEYWGRLLIVEATDAEWRRDASPTEFQEADGVQTVLKTLQLRYGELNASGFPYLRVLRCCLHQELHIASNISVDMTSPLHASPYIAYR